MKRLTRFAGLAIVVGMLAHAAPGAEPDPALRNYQAANGFLHRGMNELAAREYRAFLEQRPNHEHAATARYGLGVALFRLNQLDDAAEALSPLVQVRGFEFASDVDLLLGQALMAQGQYGEAVERFNALLKRDPGHASAPAAGAMLIESLYRSGDATGARRAADAHLERHPNHETSDRALLFAALAVMTQRDYAGASERLERLLEQFPASALAPQTTLLAAQCAQQIGATELAIRRFRSVTDGGDPALVTDAQFGLAALLHEAGELNEAGALLDRFLATATAHANRADAELRRAQIWFAQERYDEARRLLLDVSRSDHADRGAVAYWLAKCSLRQNRPDDAAQRLAAALEAAPDHALAPEMMYDGAVAFMRSDEPAAAEELFHDFFERFPNHALAPDAMALRASALVQTGEHDDAAALCAEFLRRFEDHPQASPMLHLRAESLYLAGRVDESARSFKAYLTQAEESDDARRAQFRLGAIEYQRGNYDDARQRLESLVTLRPLPEQFRPALLMLGEIAFLAREWERCEEYFEAYATAPGAEGADGALLKLGLSRQRRDQHAGALRAFDQLVRQFPDSPVMAHAQFERGQSLIALGRRDDAALAFAQVLEIGERRFAAPARNHLGALAAADGDHDSAIEHFEQAIASTDDPALRADALNRLGRSLAAAGRSADAADVFARLNREHPENRFALEARARQALALARSDDAGADAVISAISERDLASLEPSLAGALRYERAWRLRERSDSAAAAQAYRDLLDSEIDHSLRAHALVELADLQIAEEDFESATALLADARALINKGAGSPSLGAGALYRIGLCHHRSNDHDAAARALAEFIDSEEGDPNLIAPASLMLGESLFQLGRYREAVDHFGAVVATSDRDDSIASSLLRLGECHAAIQRWATSEQAFADFLSRFSDSPLWFQAQFGMGWARENLGRHQDAIEAYRRVAEQHDGATAARAQFQIGECLFALRDHQEAIAAFLKVDVLYAYPEWSAAALYEAGRCFEALGQPAEARRQFERVRNEFGDTKWAPMAASRLAAATPSSLPAR